MHAEPLMLAAYKSIRFIHSMYSKLFCVMIVSHASHVYTYDYTYTHVYVSVCLYQNLASCT